MRTFIIMIAAFIVCALAACSSPDSKFIGKWQFVDAPSKDTMVIEKKGEFYEWYRIDKPNDIMTFTYDKEHDVLTMEDRRETIDITYADSSKHLLVAPRQKRGSRDNPLELQRVD